MEKYNPNNPYPSAPPPAGFVMPESGPPPQYTPYAPQLQHQHQQPHQPQQPQTTTVVTAIPLKGEPQRMTCPFCQAEITTKVKHQAGRMSHLIALVLCLLGCWCCCCIPYCVDSCQDADHECPNCKKYLGHYRR